ncbi:ABC transporter substrate-binding protein [Liquorilactobacillus mali]|uniref:Iron ABC transporter substrate-binding protein n=1 Tax=Liquorilactobacillus mali KCTC 3596 = DSM 20444 TaxID=1046596 RepID=A0A0R2E2T6_9LACO|nr:ABC transporter substrate-binding protein [Liquorilactobacillus mali]KRN10609.1 iron ABC transporter substrate-binding protein [Liquorilactobacillus mali KCTC 3596 = DSM 20444]QFQ75361.1 ABC transporter substrate-binding protein [Liquorilactobacillus mali]
MAVVGLVYLSQKKLDSQSSEKQPRIVTTTVAITDVFSRLNMKLVGVPSDSSLQKVPSKYHNVTRVGNHVSINWDNLLTAKPDIVYVDSELTDEYQSKLKEQKIRMKSLNFQNYESLVKSIKYLGRKYDRQKDAQKLLSRIKIKNVSRVKKPKVLILMGMPGGSFLAMNSKTYLGDLVKRAGGEVVGASPTSLYTTASSEAIAEANPDIVIRLAHAMPKQVKAAFITTFKQSPYNNLKAVKEKHVYDVEAPKFSPTANLKVRQAYNQVKRWLDQVDK